MYNESFILDYPEELYLEYLSDLEKLKKLYNNYVGRYIPSNIIDGNLTLLKESLDYYVVKKLQTDPSFKNTTQFKNYIKYIKNIANFSFEVLINPFFNYVEHSELLKYLGAEKMDRLKTKRIKGRDLIKNIELKINKNEKIVQRELDLICEYYAGLKKNSLEYSNLITYIFTQLPVSRDLMCSNQVLEAILAYLPFEYIKEDGFCPENVRFCASDIKNNKEFNGPGVSFGHTPHVFMNRKLFYNINFKSIENAKRGTYLKTGDDFTFFMIVAYHEITHQLQKHKSQRKYFSDQGLMHAISNVLRAELSDYKRNHDNDEIEIDATQVGWKVCQLFFAKHFISPKQKELCVQCYKNSNGTQARRSIAAKEDADGNVINKSEYDVGLLSKIIKRNPKYLSTFPVLLNLYDSSGNLDLDILFKRSLWHSVVGNDYIEYIFFNGLWKNIIPKLKTTSSEKISNLISNIYNVINNLLMKIDRINYNLRLNLSGEYKKNKNAKIAKKELLESFCENYKQFIYLSRIILNQTKDINIINSLKVYINLLDRRYRHTLTREEQQLVDNYDLKKNNL